MFWKIYFWFLFIFISLAYIGRFLQKSLSSINVIDLIISVPSLLGFFLYAYKKGLSTAKFWRTYFIIYVIWDWSFNYVLLPRIESNYSWVMTLVGTVMIFPMWIALYLYAFKFLKENPLSR